MMLALRITTKPRRRYVEIDNLAEALTWWYSRRSYWAAAGDGRRLAIVIRRRTGGLS